MFWFSREQLVCFFQPSPYAVFVVLFVPLCLSTPGLWLCHVWDQRRRRESPGKASRHASGRSQDRGNLTHPLLLPSFLCLYTDSASCHPFPLTCSDVVSAGTPQMVCCLFLGCFLFPGSFGAGRRVDTLRHAGKFSLSKSFRSRFCLAPFLISYYSFHCFDFKIQSKSSFSVAGTAGL